MSDRIERWREAGIIDQATAGRIREYEAEHGRARARQAVGLSIAAIAGLSVGIGLISVAAANWSDIPVAVRLGADLLLGCGLAALIVRLDGDGDDGGTWGREAALVTMYLWVLASIGLVSQTYHLGGLTSSALIVWTLLTAWQMTFVRTRLAAGLWLAGVSVTWWWLLADHAERFPREDVAVGLAAVPLSVLAWVAVSRRVRDRRPEIADAALAWASAGLGLAALVAPNLLYSEASAHELAELWVAVLLGVAALAAMLPAAPRLVMRLGAAAGDPTRATMMLRLVIVETALFLLTLLLPHPSLDWAAALAFVLVCSTLAALASALDDTRAFRFAVLLVAARILIAYAELFGSLLGTGLGLIGAGLVAFGLLQFWKRYVSRFEPDREGQS
ncbi:MAG: DUF2157 domain-containing protein [Myxococcota bacterium]